MRSSCFLKSRGGGGLLCVQFVSVYMFTCISSMEMFFACHDNTCFIPLSSLKFFRLFSMLCVLPSTPSRSWISCSHTRASLITFHTCPPIVLSVFPALTHHLTSHMSTHLLPIRHQCKHIFSPTSNSSSFARRGACGCCSFPAIFCLFLTTAWLWSV